MHSWLKASRIISLRAGSLTWQPILPMQRATELKQPPHQRVRAELSLTFRSLPCRSSAVSICTFVPVKQVKARQRVRAALSPSFRSLTCSTTGVSICTFVLERKQTQSGALASSRRFPLPCALLSSSLCSRLSLLASSLSRALSLLSLSVSLVFLSLDSLSLSRTSLSLARLSL